MQIALPTLPFRKFRHNLVVQLVFFQVALLSLDLLIRFASRAIHLNTNYEMFAMSVAEFVVFASIFGFFKKETWKNLMKGAYRIGMALKLAFLGIFFKIAASIGVFAIFGSELTQKSIETQAKYIAPHAPTDGAQKLALFLAVVILGPIVEELLFRGVIYNRLKKRMSIVPAMVISSFLFGVGHIIPLLIIMTFALGLLQCFVYEKSRNIWYTIGIHMTFNVLPFLFGAY